MGRSRPKAIRKTTAKVTETDMNIFMNIGGPFDIMTGTWVMGMRGNRVLNGGYCGLGSVLGTANVGKTTLSGYIKLALYNHYGSLIFQYDSEGTGQRERIAKLARFFDCVEYDDLMVESEEDQIYFRTDVKIGATAWHDEVVGYLKEYHGLVKGKKPVLEQVPMLRRIDNEPYQMFRKVTVDIDSITYLKTEGLIDTAEEIAIGDSKKNTFNMKMGAVQSDLINQAALSANRYGANYICCCHTGTTIQMDQYAPSPSQLKGLNTGHKIRGGGKAIVDLPSAAWYISKSEVFYNSSSDKTPRFPTSEAVATKEDPDLRVMTVSNLRGKSGISDLKFKVVFSQNDGILIGLTNLMYLQDHNDFGIQTITHNRAWALDLLPDTKWGRTTIRNKSQDDHQLVLALQYTMEICHMYHHDTYYPFRDSTIEEIGAALRDIGYDMESLLDEQTRYYWVYTADESFYGDQHLTSMDIVRMAHGEYVPYWFTKEQKDKLDMTKALSVNSK